jgi:mxaD protein
MKIDTAIIFGLAALASGYAWPAAPVLHATKTVVIEASASKVWHTANDFNALNTWHPAVASDQILEGTNDTVGAVRLLTLKGGGTVKEKLLGYDAAAHSFKYTILESVLPLSDYTSTFVVKSLGKGKSEATWSGRFKRKDIGDHPGDKENDKAAIDTANAIYQGGLDNLKKIVEAK